MTRLPDIRIVENLDYRLQKLPGFSHTIRDDAGSFTLCCDYIMPSFSYFKATKTFSHPCPPFTRIFVMAEGTAEITMNGRRSQLAAGRIYLLPPEHPFTAVYHRGARIKGYHLHLYDGSGFTVGTEFDQVRSCQEPWLFKAILAASEQPEEFLRQAALLPIIDDFCRPLFPLLRRRAAPDAPYRQVLEDLAHFPPGRVRIQEIATRMHITRAALSKGFQRQFGIALKRHLINTLLQQARQLLLDTDLTVSEIADRLGYPEANYFHRLFHTHTGITPLAYRREYRDVTPDHNQSAS